MTEIVPDLWRWAVSLLFGGAGGGAVLFIGRETLKAAFNRSVQRDIEKLKKEHQQELERLKSELSREVQREQEHLRASLQAELQKAQQTTSVLHEIYPELVKRLREAEGAVCNLWGGKITHDVSKLSETEYEATLTRWRIPGEEAAETLEMLKRNREVGLERLQKLQRRYELFAARESIAELKNFLLLKEFHISRGVYEAGWAIVRKLVEAEVAVEVGEMSRLGGQTEKFLSLSKEIGRDIPEAVDLMRRELSHQAFQPALPNRIVTTVTVEDPPSPPALPAGGSSGATPQVNS